MEKLKRFIDCSVPVNTCNLRCPYCYITQTGLFSSKLPKFPYRAEHIGKAFSQERLGGACHLNMCGGGETLLPAEMTGIIEQILKQGHYIFVVTNGLVKKRFDELAQLPRHLLEQLGFKFSFHYEELLRTNKLDLFFDNVRKMWEAGCSFTVELTPYDELIPKIEEIREVCLKNVGAMCHVTVARDNTKRDLPILTKLDHDEYTKTWGRFESELFDFKISTFNVKRKEFCYAGDWSLLVNIATGDMRPCDKYPVSQNIYEDPAEPVRFSAIGCNCRAAHCYNSHAFMTLGAIASAETPTYAEMRNRVCSDGSEWLGPRMKAFLSQKLADNNEEYTEEEMTRVTRLNHQSFLKRAFKEAVLELKLKVCEIKARKSKK